MTDDTDWAQVIKEDTTQVSKVMRRGAGKHFHWCPGCEEMHPLPDSWTFDGNVEQPTFNPSFKQIGAGPNKTDCHYFIHSGDIEYCGDSWHKLAGQKIPMIDLSTVGMAE